MNSFHNIRKMSVSFIEVMNVLVIQTKQLCDQIDIFYAIKG